jgi:protein-S-isoprenylcysteine O-methyltransferase Ste14
VRPIVATVAALGLWAISWGVASIWNRRVAARPTTLEQATHLIPTVIGGAIIAFGMRVRLAGAYHVIGGQPLWDVSRPIGWALFAFAVAGFAFCWWARLTLGDLWSSTVTRKDGHTIVERGPYRLVRHPIYTGIIAAFLSLTLQVGTPAAFLGLALLIFGFWLKARLEERFLMRELGEAAYADYRRRTPMLMPFWPHRA